MKKWPLLPEYVKDWIKKLPWHSKDDPRFAREAKRRAQRGQTYNPPTKDRTWRFRPVFAVRGVCIHQLWGEPRDTPEETNLYHTGPNHISPQGCPHICYSIFVNPDGECMLCNPIHAITYSQADPSQPGSENRMFLSIGLSGKFRCTSHPNLSSPTAAQMDAVQRLWEWARVGFHLTDADIFGHFDFGKANCPGTDLERWILRTRTDNGLLILADVSDWQRSLKRLGYRVKVDGEWGPESRRVLVEFQEEHQLKKTGVFDRPTAWMMRLATEGKVEFIDFEDESLVVT